MKVFIYDFWEDTHLFIIWKKNQVYMYIFLQFCENVHKIRNNKVMFGLGMTPIIGSKTWQIKPWHRSDSHNLPYFRYFWSSRSNESHAATYARSQLFGGQEYKAGCVPVQLHADWSASISWTNRYLHNETSRATIFWGKQVILLKTWINFLQIVILLINFCTSHPFL